MVEVVIAVVILSIVVSGITLAAAGGSKLRGASKLQSAMTAAGLKAQEDIVTDRSWMDRPECRSLGAPCDVKAVIRPDSLELDGISTKGLASTSMQVVSATSQAIDSPVDKQGDQDTDGVVPDFYRIDMQLTVPQSVASRYSSTSAKLTRRMTTTIDRRGKEQEGSLAVEVCRIMNQSDERMAIQGCAEFGSSAVKMDGCPPMPRPGCVPAFGWIAGLAQSNTEPSPFVVMNRVSSGVSFTVQNITTGQTWSSGAATKDKGLFIFQNLPAGAYKINGLPDSVGGGTERWESKEVPQFHGSPSQAITGDSSAVVEPGLRNRALVLFRPSRSSTGGIDLYFDRVVHDYHLGGKFTSGAEPVVPAGTPTDSYLGGSAAKLCSAINNDGISMFTCDPIEPGPANCASLFATGFTFTDAGLGNGEWVLEQGHLQEKTGGDLHKVMINHMRISRFCTTYSEDHTYDYYASTSGPGQRVLPGAVAAATYDLAPMPDNRVVDIGGGVATVPKAACAVPARGQCGGLHDLLPGLNSGIVASASAAANDNIIHFPTFLQDRGIWVRPNGGGIVTPTGTFPPNGTVRVRGDGECYWTSSRYGGRQEGPCGTCNPVFDPGNPILGACSVLVNDSVVRTVMEYSEDFQIPSGASMGVGKGQVIARDAYDIPFSPAWRCVSSVPSLLRRTCSRQATGGGGVISNRAGRYTSPTTGGIAIVNSAPISEGAA